MEKRTCSCGGEVRQQEFRDRREVGTIVQVLLACTACSRRYPLDHFQRIAKCPDCGSAVKRSKPYQREKSAAGTTPVEYACTECSWKVQQDETQPIVFRD